MFSRDLFNIARKYIKEDKIKMIEKYQSFFVGNIEDLIDANEISLFDKNSYMYDDLSVNPDLSKSTSVIIQIKSLSRSQRLIQATPASSISIKSRACSCRATSMTRSLRSVLFSRH